MEDNSFLTASVAEEEIHVAILVWLQIRLLGQIGFPLGFISIFGI
jgi:hypothetical protein